MAIRLLFLFLFLGMAFQSWAQRVCGKVKSDNGIPIPAAVVQVLNGMANGYSNEEGLFCLNLQKGNYQLKISALGYASKVVPVQLDQDSLWLELPLTEEATQLDEVVVMANKVEQRTQEVAVSVTRLSPEKVKETRTWTLEDLRGLIPNYQYANLGVGYQQMQSIRGISVFSENPSVATYIDGVSALDVSANGLQLTDVESIEVLRGPQGTLYGRNAMGGVLNIRTKKPGNKREGFGEISVGNQGLQRYSAGYKMPLVKGKWFAGFNGLHQKLNGFYTNDLSNKMSFDGRSLKGSAPDGKRMGDEESMYGNFYVRGFLKDNTDITFNSKIQLDRSIGGSMYYQAVESEVEAVQNPYKMAVNSLGSHKRFINNHSLLVVHRRQHFHFSSTSAWQQILQTYQNIDQDLFPYDLATGATYHNKTGDPIPQHVLSQELRFSSPNRDTKFIWTAGAYFFHQQYEKRYATHYERLALLFGEKPGTQVAQNDERNYGLAGFGQAEYRFHHRWDITLGIRYDMEKRSSAISRFQLDSLDQKQFTVPLTNRNAYFQALSPKMTVGYKAGEKSNFYTSYARGFRAGGINVAQNVTGYETYKPEFSDNLEFGFKYRSSGGRFTLQSTAFFLYWYDLQLDLRTNSGVYVINNIGDVQAYGMEIEATAIPIRNLTLDASLGTNRSRYQNFDFLNVNIKGNTTILAPPVTSYLSARYRLFSSKKLGCILRSEWRYMGKQFFDLINTIQQSGYSILNARVEMQYKQAEISFWVQNLTDKQTIAYALPGYFRYTLLNRPRTVGLTVRIGI